GAGACHSGSPIVKERRCRTRRASSLSGPALPSRSVVDRGLSQRTHCQASVTFAHKLFNESPGLQTVTAWYLDTHGIQYDRTILAAYQTPFPEPVPIPPDAWARSPLRVFI